MRTRQHSSRFGFTLIELLVVIAIIAILIGLLLPAIQKVREAAARAKCSNNLKQLGVALHMYHDDNNRYPPYYPGGLAATDPKRYSENWTFLLLPYLEQGNIYNQAIPDRATYLALVRPRVIPTYLCPSNPMPGSVTNGANVIGLTNYLGVTGRQRNDWRPPPLGFSQDTGIIAVTNSAGQAVKINIASVSDGTSSTIAFAERPPVPDLQWGWATGNPNLDSLIWAQYTSADNTSSTTALGTSDINGPCPFPMYFQPPRSPAGYCDGYHMWSFHSGGSNFALADGSVRFFRYQAGATIITAMATRAMDEVVSE